MTGFGFVAPALLGALVLLPVLWWVLRATPPAPREAAFGGMFFLRGLRDDRAEPARTPWPVLITRLLAAALLIVGLAGPRLNAPEAGRSGPLVIVLDDGWPSAPGWRVRQDAVVREAARPGAEERQVWLLRTAADEPAVEGPMTMPEAAERVAGLAPSPSLPDYAAAAAALREADLDAEILWLAGAAVPDTAGRQALLRTVSGVGLTLFREPGRTVTAITGLSPEGTDLVATLRRSGSASPEQADRLRVTARDGRTLTEVPVRFAAGADETEAAVSLPLDLRNEAARLSLVSERSAGATWLVDASARRVRAGLVTEGAGDTLLTSATYLTQALAPLAVLSRGTPEALTEQGADVIVLDDVGTLRPGARQALLEWTRAGGLLLRFAGPDTAAAEATDDGTFPTALRGGGRSFGGALTWTTPQPLAGFSADGPLSGLAVPEGLEVRRQVLSRQGQDAEVWAYLADGTPLVTARSEGQGLVVLVHVTASPTWSDLPVSGLFPTMLRRVLTRAGTSALAERTTGPQPAIALLDGFGGLFEPAEAVEPATPEALAAGTLTPGLYGTRDAPLAVNAYLGEPPLASPTRGLPVGARVVGPDRPALREFGPPLIAVALLLLALDALLLLWLGGRSRRLAPAAACLLVLLLAPAALAQPRPPLDEQAVRAAEQTRFAYVETGDPALDRISRAGLFGLTREAFRRSALEPAAPVGVDPERDDLSVYPLIYWPITGSTDVSDDALFALEDFMAGGGLVVIDTMDGERAGDASPAQQRLREVLSRMDTPPLEPLREGHVLTLSFYRLEALHGRNSGGTVWVEAESALRETQDGVPSLIVGGRDWASAWAVDEAGVPLRSAGPGGERRREYAYRSGINIAMVALTGSYKTDQVHVGELLERLERERR